MNLEFNIPESTVPEIVLQYIRTKIILLHNRAKQVGRVEVFLEEKDCFENCKHCRINIVIFDNSISIERTAGNYMIAAQKVLNAIAVEIDNVAEKHSEPPGTISTSVYL